MTNKEKMMITTPKILNRCENRSISARINPQSGGPEDWFTNHNLKLLGIQSFSFDFFVNWETNRFVRTIWFKRFFDKSINGFIGRHEWKSIIEQYLVAHEGEEQLQNLYNFCEEQKLHADFLIFNEYNWNVNEKIIYARLKSSNSFFIKAITLNELKLKIRQGTGRPFYIGDKGLIYSTSKLECYLSRTDTPYPGDADILLKNNDRYGFKLIEFKKHNLNTSITSQQLSNYFPHPDGTKYRRLNLLSNYLPNTQLYTLYYTTDDRFETKLELNSYSGDGLIQGATTLLGSPKNKNNTDEILKYISDCVDFFSSN